MAKFSMPDVIVLLPGITGSQLSKDGKVVWGLKGGTLFRSLLTRGGHLRRSLMLEEDPVDADDLGDGVVADRLIPDLHLLPGLWKIDGYSKVSEAIRRTFEVQTGENFFHFPYDWRRDNRVAARKLRRQTGDWLRRWREQSGNDDARLILVAHSMGGLVARYFLEVLGGWQDTRALVTFGTPYRGSLNAVDTLVNGMRKGPFGLMDLSTLARSFTAIYQLLPIYRCYDPGDGTMIRLAEADAIPNVDPSRVKTARAFHHEILDAVEANRKEDAYHRAETGYRLSPFVGIAQRTKQGARRKGDGATMLERDFEGEDKRGDGTVPRVSAVPPDYAGRGVEKYSAVKHGSMQNANGVHTGLEGVITGLYFDLGDFLAPPMAPMRVAMDVEDLYLRGEPIEVRVQPETPADMSLIARLVDTARGRVVTMKELGRGADGVYEATFEPQAEGAYEVQVDGGASVEPTAEAFAVSDVTEDELSREMEV